MIYIWRGDPMNLGHVIDTAAGKSWRVSTGERLEILAGSPLALLGEGRPIKDIARAVARAEEFWGRPADHKIGPSE